MGLDPGDKPRYQISSEDSKIIKAYQVMKQFHCLDWNVYLRNPAWVNEAFYGLLRTENKVESDKIEESRNG